MFRPSKPETISRRAAGREAERVARKLERVTRLQALTEQHGPDSIWAELLSIEHEVQPLRVA
jgi:hypothetical protein